MRRPATKRNQEIKLGIVSVKSRELYSVLRANLGPQLASQGFRLARSGTLTYERRTDSWQVRLHFQCDKWGWDKDWGSKFTLNVVVQTIDEHPGATQHRGGRFFHLLAPISRETVRELNNSVVSSLPGALKNAFVTIPDDEGNQVLIIGEKPALAPYFPGWDIWLHYYSTDDVARWSAFLGPSIEQITARLISAPYDA